jgi:alpha-galactosidase
VAYVPDPDLIRVQLDPQGPWAVPARTAVGVSCLRDGDGLAVVVEAGGAVSRIHLRWRRQLPPDATVLGDAWERTYGDVAWQAIRGEQLHPWMVVVHSPTAGSWSAGVDVRTGSFAGWSVDPVGVSLWLDLRAGADPVQLGERALPAAVVRWVTGDEAYETQCTLASAVCRDPLPVGPLVGANNWYYAYGKDFGLDAVIRDARMISELSGAHPVRPFAVVDDGWSVDGLADGRPASGGPWDRGRGDFRAMADVASAISAEGVRPGLWFRPLLWREQHPAALRAWDGGFALDPSHPAAVGEVAASIHRFASWGFQLIKHDFSTYETLGRWGFQMGPHPAAPDVHVADRTRTTAEVLVDLYRAIHEAAGDAVILGCNVVGHLAAGLVHAQRTGDDTSGRIWERTRRMGINTLAFRLAQNGRFFTVDADCVPSTPQTDWALNRQYLDLVARSGTALFVSVDPATRTDEVDADLAAALRIALDGGVAGGIEPLDWFSTTTPRRWRCGDEIRTYDWLPTFGGDPYDVGGTLFS